MGRKTSAGRPLFDVFRECVLEAEALRPHIDSVTKFEPSLLPVFQDGIYAAKHPTWPLDYAPLAHLEHATRYKDGVVGHIRLGNKSGDDLAKAFHRYVLNAFDQLAQLVKEFFAALVGARRIAVGTESPDNLVKVPQVWWSSSATLVGIRENAICEVRKGQASEVSNRALLGVSPDVIFTNVCIFDAKADDVLDIPLSTMMPRLVAVSPARNDRTTIIDGFRLRLSDKKLIRKECDEREILDLVCYFSKHNQSQFCRDLAKKTNHPKWESLKRVLSQLLTEERER